MLFSSVADMCFLLFLTRLASVLDAINLSVLCHNELKRRLQVGYSLVTLSGQLLQPTYFEGDCSKSGRPTKIEWILVFQHILQL